MKRPAIHAAAALVVDRSRGGPGTRLVHEDEGIRAGLVFGNGGQGGVEPVVGRLMCGGIHATIIT